MQYKHSRESRSFTASVFRSVNWDSISHERFRPPYPQSEHPPMPPETAPTNLSRWTSASMPEFWSRHWSIASAELSRNQMPQVRLFRARCIVRDKALRMTSATGVLISLSVPRVGLVDREIHGRLVEQSTETLS